MQSCLYECRVMHHRLVPKEHKFSYRIFVLALDLDELETCHKAFTFFSLNRWNLYSFNEADYVPTYEKIHNPSQNTSIKLTPALNNSLKERVISYLALNGIDCAGGKVTLVTVPRIFGYAFNPVSFYYCYNQTGELVAAMAEVTNTFKEMKLYVVNKSTVNNRPRFQARIPKNFYVSPFSKVDLAFDFDLCEPSDSFAVRIDDYDGELKTLISTMSGPKRDITDARLMGWLFKYPLITFRIIALIHVHALRLYLKNIPWFKKTSAADRQKDLFRPHQSLNQ